MQKQPILNIDEVKKELDKAEPYKDIENQGQFIQTIYLGSILSLTPSGKIYTPWANSNLDLCTRCKGEGKIKNKHGSIKKVDWWEQLESELEQINTWYHGSEGDGCDIMISRVAADKTEE